MFWTTWLAKYLVTFFDPSAHFDSFDSYTGHSIRRGEVSVGAGAAAGHSRGQGTVSAVPTAMIVGEARPRLRLSHSSKHWSIHDFQ